MRWRLCVMAFLSIWSGACFSPNYPEGIPCSEVGSCPPGMSCDTRDQVCRRQPLGPSCDDGLKNGVESDVDCGGACPGCPAGGACGDTPDCVANSGCVEGVCQCEAGFVPDSSGTCEAIDAIDDCAQGPCLNGGTCTDGGNGYTCTCLAGFAGTHCETPCEQGNCVGTVTCAQDDPTARVCPDGCVAGYRGEACARYLEPSCLAWRDAGMAESGFQLVDPDGPDGNAPFEVYCDMDTDEGGWTLIGDYVSTGELFAFDPNVHQLQNDSGGTVVDAPPRLDGTLNGHIAYGTIAHQETRLQCRPGENAEWFGARTALFTDWSPGDRGVYGSEHWAIRGGGTHGRSNHFICGHQINGNGIFPGIAICKGPGVGGSFINHVVSLSFDDSRSSYTGGLSIGCNGVGLNSGKNALWRARVWLR